MFFYLEVYTFQTTQILSLEWIELAFIQGNTPDAYPCWAYSLFGLLKVHLLSYNGVICIPCEIETLGEHKLLLDLVVLRLRDRTDAISAGWEKKEALQEDFDDKEGFLINFETKVSFLSPL